MVKTRTSAVDLYEHLRALCEHQQPSLDKRLEHVPVKVRKTFVKMVEKESAKSGQALRGAFGEHHDRMRSIKIVTCVLMLPEMRKEYGLQAERCRKAVRDYAKEAKVLYLLRPAPSQEDEIKAFFRQREGSLYPNYELVEQVDLFLRQWLALLEMELIEMELIEHNRP